MLQCFSRLIIAICLLMPALIVRAQITSANNGLTASGATVSLGGTLNNAQTAIDFGSSNTSSDLLIKKGTSNYFFIGNGGNIGVGNNSPAQRLDVTGSVKSSTGFMWGSTVGGTLDITGTYARFSATANTDGLDFSTTKSPSSIKFRINNGGRGLSLDGSSANLLFMGGSGETLSGMGNANGTGHLTFLYSTAANSQTEGARLTNTGNFLIGTATDAGKKLQVSGTTQIGDASDPTQYASLQLTRPSNQGDNKFHLAFIRNGNSVSGMGYAPNSNVLGIWHANNNLSTPLLSFTYDQKAGFGTSSPRSKVDVWGGDLYVTGNDGNGTALITSHSGIAYYGNDTYANGLAITPTGNIGIGTSAPGDNKLAVDGTIAARKVKVTNTNPWPDYVFEPDYNLPSLQEVEQFLQLNKHLSGVPSAREVKENGLDLGDNQAILLKKIEELTLYLIDQSKIINDLKKKTELLETDIIFLSNQQKNKPL